MALKHTIYEIMETAAIPKTMNDAVKQRVDRAIQRIKHMVKNEYENDLSGAFDAYMKNSAFGPELRRRIWNELSKTWK